MRIQLSPVMRVSFGLLMLTLSLLLISDWLGLIPHAHKLETENRKKLSQNLAIQLSSLAMSGEVKHIRTTLTALVERNDDVVSAAFRSIDGQAEIIVGEPGKPWHDLEAAPPGDNLVEVPIFRGEQRWGSVNVLFTEGKGAWLSGYYDNNFLLLLLFMSVPGISIYSMFLKRTLRQLDPRKVIPQRVKAAFDSLAEGVLILDEHCNIVLANRAFGHHVRKHPDHLVGRPADSLSWSTVSGEPADGDSLPWRRVVQSRDAVTGGRLALFSGAEVQRNYAVNCTPIYDERRNIRGVICTFDDLTELEQKNATLQETLSELTASKLAVDQKSKELEFLATRDPLTNCLNRRAFNEQFPRLVHKARDAGESLVCMMVDIDHFKSVNDSYGHSMGDKVIRFMADTIAESIRKGDLLARLGGEEFCVVLCGTSLAEAKVIAERMRAAVRAGDPRRFTASLRVTASFGLAALDDSIEEHTTLVNRADKALYAAKAGGRDRVYDWSMIERGLVQGSISTLDPHAETQPHRDESAEAGEAGNDSVHHRIRELERIAEEKAQQLDHYFAYDSLTNLPMRQLFADRVDQALLTAERRDSVVAVLSLGIEDLARINATLGHEYVEEMLRETAQRLSGALRTTDSVSLFSEDDEGAHLSRLNDGEFGVLLGGIRDRESITWIVKRMFDALQEPFFVNQHSLNISSSVGIAVYPNDGNDAATLMRKASVSLYYADQQPGHNVVEYYSDDMNRMSREQLHIESELLEAIDNEDFLVYFQPQIDLATKAVSGFEALVRWNHPTRGVLPPIEFIDIAEQSRLINAIGELVLRESCTRLREFDQHSSQRLTIAVNVSPVQLSQPNLVERTLKILEETGVEPDRLELELTETCLMENLDTALDSLSQLHDAGIRISIDDFGTGYSALSYLRTLPVDTLKVDRAFVADIDTSSDDHAIISAIVSMASALGLDVVAEGVETQEQLKALVSMDCGLAQGYYFSRPVPAEEAVAYLQENAEPEQPTTMQLASWK